MKSLFKFLQQQAGYVLPAGTVSRFKMPVFHVKGDSKTNKFSCYSFLLVDISKNIV